jgi:hypothetical protein
MAVVEQYWGGVLQRLQAEVDVFNRLIPHPGEQGRENELSLSRLIDSLIPRRYGTGSGILIDALGGESAQTDIVIYNQTDEPAILAQTSQVLYPVENVRACIEVKTTVDAREIKDAGKKFEAIRNLQSQARYGSHPICSLLAYGSRTYAATIASNLVELPRIQRPDMLCVLNQALLGGFESWLLPDEPTSDAYIVGVARLHIRDGTGQRRAREYVEPSPHFVEAQHRHEGVTYPIVRFNDSFVVAEPSRALLLFCESLVRALAVGEGRPVPSLAHYVAGVARDLSIIQKVT